MKLKCPACRQKGVALADRLHFSWRDTACRSCDASFRVAWYWRLAWNAVASTIGPFAFFFAVAGVIGAPGSPLTLGCVAIVVLLARSACFIPLQRKEDRVG